MEVQKFIFVGGRNIATEIEKNGCAVEYIAASDFLMIQDEEYFCNTTTVLAQSNVLSELKYGNQTFIPMKNIIDKFTKIKALHKVALSSASVYGLRSSRAPLGENSRLLGSSRYALEKKNLESRIRKSRKNNDKITILRPSSIVYSDLTKSGNLFTKLSQLQNGQRDQLIVEHGGMQLRDFCTIDALINVLKSCYNCDGPSVFNVADIEAASVKAIINQFLENNKLNNVVYDVDETNKLHCHLDIELAKQRFGIKKHLSLTTDLLINSAKYFRTEHR